MAQCFVKASLINGFSFKHCPRDANRVAHNLAKKAYASKDSLTWDGDPLGFILADVISDVTVLQNNVSLCD